MTHSSNPRFNVTTVIDNNFFMNVICVSFGIFFLLCSSVRADLSEEVAANIKKSTVRVVILGDDEVKGHGSGFIVTEKGHIITNRHVIEDAEKVAVIYSDGDKVFLRKAEIVGISSTADLAILKIDAIPKTTVVEIANTELVAAQAVMTVGFPGAIDSGSWATLAGVDFDEEAMDGKITSAEAMGDYTASVFPGTVAKCMTESGVSMILHSAKISGGNSGGPLIDAEGRVCGINTALVPASMAGADYPISIHVSELVSLARIHSVKLDVTNSRVSSTGHIGLKILLYASIAAFAVVMFLVFARLQRRKAISSEGVQSMRPVPSRTIVDRPAVVPQEKKMRLRGRDLQGRSFDIHFTGSDFQQSGGKLVIGRNQDLCQLRLPHDSVSRQHATLTFQSGSFFVEDRNSGNGTKVNGCELKIGAPPAHVRSGDKLTLGEVDMIFEIVN